MQYDTHYDGWYFGVWVNPEERLIVTYVEGDVSLVECPTLLHFYDELQWAQKFYGPPSCVTENLYRIPLVSRGIRLLVHRQNLTELSFLDKLTVPSCALTSVKQREARSMPSKIKIEQFCRILDAHEQEREGLQLTPSKKTRRQKFIATGREISSPEMPYPAKTTGRSWRHTGGHQDRLKEIEKNRPGDRHTC